LGKPWLSWVVRPSVLHTLLNKACLSWANSSITFYLVEISDQSTIGHVVGENLIGCAVLDIDLFVSNEIGDEEIFDVELTRALPNTCPTIVGECYCRHIVLVNYGVIDTIALSFQEILGPYNLCDVVVNSNQFRSPFVLLRRTK
jgi:hypothetical protein